MSGSLESVHGNACVHRLDLGLYSHLKEIWRIGVRTHVNSRGKILSTGKKFPQRRMEPTMLHQAGQQAQHTTKELFQSPVESSCIRTTGGRLMVLHPLAAGMNQPIRNEVTSFQKGPDVRSFMLALTSLSLTLICILLCICVCDVFDACQTSPVHDLDLLLLLL